MTKISSFAGLAAALMLMAVPAQASSPPPPPAPAPAAEAPASPPAPGTLDLGPYKGRVVLLDFWASWCVPCAESFPWLAIMKERYAARGLTVLTVNLDADKAAADAFLERHPLDAPHYFDANGTMAEAYGLSMMPTSILFDRDGNPAFRHEGFKRESIPEYERHIVALLEGKEAGTEGIAARGAKQSTFGPKPWQRQILSRKEMLLISDPLEALSDDHIYFSKEASSGGRGFGGGGCGCN